MASSAGREKLRSRGQRVFAFGSSTPRDFSHMNKVPPKLRRYDARSVDKSPSDGPSLHDYIVKARSLSREGGDSRNQFVFGSSTPRTLAHHDKIPHKQRVYDAKIPKKSVTHNDFKAAPIRFNAPPAPISKPVKKEEKRHVITSKDDDIASEPDFVTDREEFLNEMKTHKLELEKKKSLAKCDSNNPTELQNPKTAETQQESVKFAHAPEIAGIARSAVRIQSETQEEAPVAMKILSADKMHDQLEVSQLMNEMTPESVQAVEESVGNQSNVVGDLLAKVQKVAEQAADKTKTAVADVENTIKKVIDNAANDEAQAENGEKSLSDESKNEEVESNIAEKVNDITKSLKKSAKGFAENAEQIGSKVENSFDAAEQKLEDTFAKIGSAADIALDDVKTGLSLVHF